MIQEAQNFQKLKVLSLGYTRELLVPPELEKGDTAKRMSYYAAYLDKYFVLVFSLRKDGLKRKETGNMLVIPANGLNRFDALFKMYKLGSEICRQNQIDVIQAQDPIFTGFIGYLLRQKYKKPLNVCVYGCDPYDGNWLREKKINFILAPVSKYIISRCDGVQVDGLKVMRSLIKKGKILSSKIFYKPMILADMERFKKADGGIIRRELLKNEEEKLLLFVGRLAKQKNIPFLLSCFKKILRKFSRVRLIIVGEGREERKLKDLGNKLAIGEKINWTGAVPYSKIPEYFKAANIFVLPSLYEGFARVLMEAAAASKPIISADVGGTEDVIVDGKNGFIISQGDEKGFVEKTLFLLQNPEVAEKMGEEGRKIMETKFDLRQTLLGQINIWNKIVQK